MQRGRAVDEIKSLVAAVTRGEKTRDEVLRTLDFNGVVAALKPSLPASEELAERGHAQLARGLGASAGVGSGELVLHADTALAFAAEGRDVVLVRPETSADEVDAIRASRAVLTATGGMTSHAAVMTRGIGKPCVVGCDALRIDDRAKTITLSDPDTRAILGALREGDLITIDGNSGHVYGGTVVPLPAAQLSELRTVLEWADSRRKLRVFANASNAYEVREAMHAGADGVGLCRLEQTLATTAARRLLRVALFAQDGAAKDRAIEELGALLVRELGAMFAISNSIAVRLFDAPLAELAPSDETSMQWFAQDLGISASAAVMLARDYQERWPSFGARGVRTVIAHPAFARMQISAIEEAARTVGAPARILAPFVSFAEELAHVRTLLQPSTELGAMMETPRACLVAREIAKQVSFISFGTNDLTQATLGMGRDDAHSWLSTYKRMSPTPIAHDPFRALDRMGVGALMRLAVVETRSVRNDMQVYVCGEHGTDMNAIHFFNELEIDGVSCGPAQVPATRLAAGKVTAISST